MNTPQRDFPTLKKLNIGTPPKKYKKLAQKSERGGTFPSLLMAFVLGSTIENERTTLGFWWPSKCLYWTQRVPMWCIFKGQSLCLFPMSLTDVILLLKESKECFFFYLKQNPFNIMIYEFICLYLFFSVQCFWANYKFIWQ